MRPRLGEDVRYVPSPQGVYLHSGAGEATLRGKHSYEWLRRLAPYLTGQRELTELTEALPAAARQMVTDLVGMLHEQGFVTDASGERPHTLTAIEQATYAAEITFIRYALDSAEYRFQRYRQAGVLLLGAGPLVIALVEASLTAGCKTVRVAAGTPEQAQQFHDAGQRARRDAEQRLDIVATKAVDDLGDDLVGVDVVFQVVTAGYEPDLLAVARVAEQTEVILGQILLSGDHAWLGPVGHPTRTGTASAWRRLGAHGLADPQDARDPGSAGEDPAAAGWLTGPVPALIAGRLCLGAFRALTGLDERPRPLGAPANVLTCLDLRTLDSRVHRFLSHPLARPVSDAPPHIGSPTSVDGVDGMDTARVAITVLATGAILETGQLLDAASACVDPRTGILATLDEEDFTQLPLAVARATVSDPCGLLPSWAPPVTVIGYGADRDQARVRTLCAAFATYGSLALDPRRLRPPTDPPGVGTGKEALTQASVWGHDLIEGVVRPVPARTAFPVLAGPGMPYRAPLGAAAGLSWAEAVSSGLRQHCQALLATRLDHALHPFPQAPLTTPVLTERGAELLSLLATARQPVSAYDLSALLDLPAYAVCAGDTTVALCCATTVAEAITAGLEQVLLAWQATTQGRTAYAPRTPHPLLARLRGPLSPGWQPMTGSNPAAASEPATSHGAADGAMTNHLAGVLAAQTGCRPVAVPLDHDPEAVGVLPYLVQVVLLDD